MALTPAACSSGQRLPFSDPVFLFVNQGGRYSPERPTSDQMRLQ